MLNQKFSGPRDYPLTDGSSIYLGSKGRDTGIVRVPLEKISNAIRHAEDKGLVAIEDIPYEEAVE